MVVARDEGGQCRVEMVKRHKLTAIKQVLGLMYSTATLVNNTVLYIWMFLREYV